MCSQDIWCNLTEKQLIKRLREFSSGMLTCPACSGRGGTGQFVGGVGTRWHPPCNKEIKCGRCKGRGHLVPSEDMNISMIAAMSKNRIIGKDNELPWSIPGDMKYFRDMTKGCTVIMGRKTFESIGRILPKRFNIIISKTLKTLDCESKDAIIVNSLEAALKACEPSDKIMIIGGGEVYKKALPYAKCVYLTIIDMEIDGDTTFPELDEQQWEKVISIPGKREDGDPPFSFNTYERY